MNLTFRMLQHTSSEVTVGKITNKPKHKVRDWYLIRKMKKIYKQTDGITLIYYQPGVRIYIVK